jgi:hypothetical protein
VDFEATDQLLIIHSVFVIYLRKIGIKRSSASALYRLQRSYVSVRREIFFNIIIEYGITIQLVRLIKISLGEKYS